MNIIELKNIIKEVIAEEQDYQMLFKAMLNKTGKDINSMSDEEKKKFFSAVDKAYKAKTEGRLNGYVEDFKKKNLDESITGVLSVLTGLILGKVIFYWIGNLISKGLKWIKEPELSQSVKAILEQLSNDKKFIDGVTEIVNKEDGLTTTSVNSIVNLDKVQNLIKKELSKNKNINKNDIEDSIKTIFLKAWGDKAMITTAVNKVKNDIK